MNRRIFLSLFGTGISGVFLPHSSSIPTHSLAPANHGKRDVLRLNSTWDVEESVSPDEIPASFSHKVQVPGLTHSAMPPFADVDDFNGGGWIKELRDRKTSANPSKQDAAQSDLSRFTRQRRRYFWYRVTFAAPRAREIARLKINKAQFGTVVWVNEKKIGEHWGCFTAGHFDITNAIRWSDQNELVIRIGAIPAVLPDGVIGGVDWEKKEWTPGIYDEVSVSFSDNPSIERVQVAPRLSPREITVQTTVRNYGPTAVECSLRFEVRPWKSSQVIQRLEHRLSLAAGSEQQLTVVIPLPGAQLWSPEEPHLYTLETITQGDHVTTRFGLRELRFDTPTQRAYLNGQQYFLRGSNIALHRFFEDPLAGELPWNEAWVRKLLIDVPKKMSWNCFRFTIGPVPDQWLDIADEAGLVIQYEYPIWLGPPDGGNNETYKVYSQEQLIAEFTEWIHDNCNHPCVAMWDASNESWFPGLSEKIIPQVRTLDLSHRAWENSYNPPAAPNDPAEQHPYLFDPSSGNTIRIHSMAELEPKNGAERALNGPPTSHALILNEYGYLCLNRDGSPTTLTKKIWDGLLSPEATDDERLEEYAYLIAGLTEYWRAYRHFAAVMHFVYLAYSMPDRATSDSFRDVVKLTLQPRFEEYVSNAFRPLGVYINFWQPALRPGSARNFEVMMINDHPTPASGTLAVVFETIGGQPLARTEVPFALAGLGQETYIVNVKIPQASGKCWLKAIATPTSGKQKDTTVSRRHIELRDKA